MPDRFFCEGGSIRLVVQMNDGTRLGVGLGLLSEADDTIAGL